MYPTTWVVLPQDEHKKYKLIKKNHKTWKILINVSLIFVSKTPAVKLFLRARNRSETTQWWRTKITGKFKRGGGKVVSSFVLSLSTPLCFRLLVRYHVNGFVSYYIKGKKRTQMTSYLLILKCYEVDGHFQNCLLVSRGLLTTRSPSSSRFTCPFLACFSW